MKKFYLLILILNILISIAIGKTYLLTTNTLSNNGNWDSEKTKLEKGLMGAWNYFSETQPVHKNKLNLSSWHGFQEITSIQSFQFNQLEFDVILENDAYLITHLIIQNNQKFSIKLTNKSTENYCLIIDENGKFIEKTPLVNIDIKPNEISKIKINLNETHATITVGNNSGNCNIPLFEDTKIGFKGSWFPSTVDNITLKLDNKIVFQESFSNNKNIFSLVATIFIFTILIQLSIIKKINKFLLVAINLSLLLSTVTTYIYLVLFFTGNYPNVKSIVSNLGKQEVEWADNEVENRSKNLMNKFENDNHEKIMFIGSSQTWGAGASTDQKDFPAVFERILNNKLTESPNDASASAQVLGISTENEIRVVNAGIDGQTSTELLKVYQNNYIKLKPTILFINLSNNDFTYGNSEEIFRENIESFININKENNIKTILLVEANSIEAKMSNPFREVIIEISKNNDVPVININKYLEENDDSGLIWWDYVHPTNYGYQLIAEHILNEITQETSLDH